ncbi:phosphoribosylformylglycinamidine synthase subunit PurS [Glycomyces salinus]|uniref:phosphoribosylformylglycinamidine synthase subunit PurS n=1 Tax=Glycomyces salinus TaxID=980294 RepID=UPI0018EAAB10|nr:phosphoribosylformylglycinamidine synthase subunit PurS [Glycomyces salinus]
MARVVVDVMLKSEILDPQGEAVLGALPRLGVNNVKSVRIGKRVELEFDDEGVESEHGDDEGVESASSDDAGAETERTDGAARNVREQAQIIADKLLANPVIENFEISVPGEDAA